jgi:hypothetical protein
MRWYGTRASEAGGEAVARRFGSLTSPAFPLAASPSTSAASACT